MANAIDDPQFARSGVEMVQAAVLLGVCLLVGLISLAVCAWVVISGQLFTIDGLLMLALSLTVGAFFVGDFAWSVHTGEVWEVLNDLWSQSKKVGTQQDPPR